MARHFMMELSGGRWRIIALHASQRPADSAPLALGECGSAHVALRLWMALVAQERH